MATWIWIVIAVAAVVVLAALVLGGRKAKQKRVVQQREKAQAQQQTLPERCTARGRIIWIICRLHGRGDVIDKEAREQRRNRGAQEHREKEKHDESENG